MSAAPTAKSMRRNSGGPAETWILAAIGLVALVPFVWFRHRFELLFWFGDEFDLLGQIDRMGFWPWLWTVFAENFVPLFKLLWGGAVFLFGGSYLAMLVLLWLTHALNTFLLGRVLRGCALPWSAVLLAQLVFALVPGNMETLIWSVQWSAVLSCTFMLWAFDGFVRVGPEGRPFGWRTHGPLLAAATGAALCFSRGVLVGMVLALACAWPAPDGRVRAGRPGAGAGAASPVGLPWRWPLTTALCALAPAVLTAMLIATFANGNHHDLHGRALEAATYGLWYFCLNPGFRLLGIDSWGWHTVVALGLLKLALIVWTLSISRGGQRRLLLMFVVYDLGNAALLGLGRYHTGLETTISSRYQYASLLGIMPLAGFWLAAMIGRLPWGAPWRRMAAAAAVIALVVATTRGWSPELDSFVIPRGVDSRRVLLVEANPGERAVPGIPFMSTEEGRRLIAEYDLH
jgi:hypothetical protein